MTLLLVASKVPADLRQHLKDRADENRRTLSMEVRIAIERYLGDAVHDLDVAASLHDENIDLQSALADAQADVARLRRFIEDVDLWAHEQGIEGLAERAAAALSDEGEKQELRDEERRPMDVLTFNEHGAAMQAILAEARAEAGQGDAGRDLALAATHLEDALTRYNSARYRMKGTWMRADPDRS